MVRQPDGGLRRRAEVIVGSPLPRRNRAGGCSNEPRRGRGRCSSDESKLDSPGTTNFDGGRRLGGGSGGSNGGEEGKMKGAWVWRGRPGS